MKKTLYSLITSLTLMGCAHERNFYVEDFREEIPVTSKVVKVEYKVDDNGQNKEITLYDKHTGNSYRLARRMSNKSLTLEKIASTRYKDNIPNFGGLPLDTN